MLVVINGRSLHSRLRHHAHFRPPINPVAHRPYRVFWLSPKGYQRRVNGVDGRNTTDLPAFKGTDYQRPEDLQIQQVGGREYLYIAMTTTHDVHRLDLRSQKITVLANEITLPRAAN